MEEKGKIEEKSGSEKQEHEAELKRKAEANRVKESQYWTLAQFFALCAVALTLFILFSFIVGAAGAFLVLGICLLIILLFLKFAWPFNEKLAEVYKKAFLPLLFAALIMITITLTFLKG